MGLKLGWSNPEGMAWEYHQKVRPFLQPYLYLYPTKLFTYLGLDFFQSMTILRILQGIFGQLCFFWLANRWIPFLKTALAKKWCIYLVTFTWFLPYLHVRTNAESMSLAFLSLGIGLFLGGPNSRTFKNGILAGLFLGLSYAFRYQMAVNVAALWIVFFILWRTPRFFIPMAFSILLIIFGGVFIDFLGHGEWSFAPYNLFVGNFIQGRLENSGEDPWWYFFKTAFMRGVPPLSFFLMLGALLPSGKLIRSPLFWGIWPLFIFHSVIGHKELRYIFPSIALGLLFFPVSLESFSFFRKFMKSKVVTYTLVSMNIVLLLFSIFRASNPSVNFYRYLKGSDIKRIGIYEGSDPYEMVGLKLQVYRKDAPSMNFFESSKVKEEDFIDQNPYVFVGKGKNLNKLLDRYNCQVLYSTYPLWALNFNIGNWVERSRFWSVLNCRLK